MKPALVNVLADAVRGLGGCFEREQEGCCICLLLVPLLEQGLREVYPIPSSWEIKNLEAEAAFARWRSCLRGWYGDNGAGKRARSSSSREERGKTCF